MIRKWIILFILLATIFPNLQHELLSQESSPESSMVRTVIVCPNPDPDLSLPCYFQEGAVVFPTLDTAYEALVPDGGGEILINPGIYKTSLFLEGEWTLKGLRDPSSIVLVSRDRARRSNGIIIGPSGAIMIGVNATITLENLTFYDDVNLIDLPKGLETASGVSMLNSRNFLGESVGGNLTMKNVYFENFFEGGLVVRSGSQALIENSEFRCPPHTKGSFGIILDGSVEFNNSEFDHCQIFGGSSDFDTPKTFTNNEFRNTSILLSGNPEFRNNTFRDTFNSSRTLLDFTAQLLLTGNGVIEGNVFENRQQFDIPENRVHQSIFISGGEFSIENNFFTGFDKALYFSSGLSPTKITLSNNIFDGNATAIEFDPMINDQLILLARQNLFSNNTCMIHVESSNEFIEISGSSNASENNQQITCPEEFLLPEGFVASE